jgi:hypothetical protein
MTTHACSKQKEVRELIPVLQSLDPQLRESLEKRQVHVSATPLVRDRNCSISLNEFMTERWLPAEESDLYQVAKTHSHSSNSKELLDFAVEHEQGQASSAHASLLS